MAQIIKDPAPILNLMALMGINQTRLAQLANLDNSKMSLSLNGKREVSIHELIRIAAALETDWRDLLCVFGVDAPPLPAPITATEARLAKLEAQVSALLAGIEAVNKYAVRAGL